MNWPELVHLSEIQSRLLHDGLPVERAMKTTSEIGLVPYGGSYRIERSQGDLYLHAQGAGYYRVTAA